MSEQESYNTRQTLIQRMKDGDNEQSWEEFLQIYRPYIYAIIRNMNVSGDDAEDIVQHVMLKVWKGIGKVEYSPVRRFRNWLSTVTSNCVKDFIRKRAAAAERLEVASRDDTLSYLHAIALPDIDRIAEKEWGTHLANMAMERIEGAFSKKAVQSFMMSLEGVPAPEIAQKLDIKLNSVYRLKNRVKERLAEEIELLRSQLE